RTAGSISSTCRTRLQGRNITGSVQIKTSRHSALTGKRSSEKTGNCNYFRESVLKKLVTLSGKWYNVFNLRCSLCVKPAGDVHACKQAATRASKPNCAPSWATGGSGRDLLAAGGV